MTERCRARRMPARGHSSRYFAIWIWTAWREVPCRSCASPFTVRSWERSSWVGLSRWSCRGGREPTRCPYWVHRFGRLARQRRNKSPVHRWRSSRREMTRSMLRSRPSSQHLYSPSATGRASAGGSADGWPLRRRRIVAQDCAEQLGHPGTGGKKLIHELPKGRRSARELFMTSIAFLDLCAWATCCGVYPVSSAIPPTMIALVPQRRP